MSYGSMYAYLLMRTRAVELFAVHLQLIHGTWAQVMEWHAKIAAVDSPEDVREPTEDSKSVFEVRI